MFRKRLCAVTHRYVAATVLELYAKQADKEFTMATKAADPIKILLAILLPPLGVFLQVGLTGHFWLNILLTLLGYIPGIIHAVYVILRR
jgi:uncharacterized membrane protein YqaE (UPF0057 family)